MGIGLCWVFVVLFDAWWLVGPFAASFYAGIFTGFA